ncbi:SDR family oxidoreductase [Sansalvadorimonas verongulae]|uniref:SDR family oxidoreductase n=1 Tax=Sansalvadorimonas verongulae TaxID=2172824 RepID=UPI0012BB95BD|nr:NAD(P)-dependent oxidoreductase [Sansalvadorimonas verongulae]MTI14705.1 NAD-dependent epimerase/dehydratase family protein [Sansalvadorimonas verongulae]
MEVLIIGGSGQIGQELCRLLESHQISFRAPARHELDIEDHRNVARLIEKWQPDVVVNTAGYRAAGKAQKEPSRCFSYNRDAVSNLADTCHKVGAALVQISSWRVFDGSKVDAYTEKDTPNPEGVLGNSFWQGEQQIHQRCPRHIILRLSWIISHLGRNRATKLLDNFSYPEAERALQTHINHRGCPTTAEDVARVLLAITQQIGCNTECWGTYHYSAAEPTDEFTLAEVIFAEASQFQDIPNERLHEDESEKAINACLDGRNLRNTFGIMPRPWRSAVARLVRNYFEEP